MSQRNKILLTLSVAAIVLTTIIAVIIWKVQTAYPNRYTVDTIPHTEVIMILGASLKPDNTPSAALEDRLKVGIELYKKQNAPLILVTGDDGKNHTDEVSIMKKYLIDNGIPTSTIAVDGQGYRTYESCKHAGTKFDFHYITVVTQAFHMPRALYLCNHLGVQAYGVTSDLQPYKDAWYDKIRDLLASFKAWWDINVMVPNPPVK